MFLGYCYLHDGTHTDPVHLKGMEAVKAYISLQLPLQHKVVICDSDDYIIFESLEGQVVFP